MIIDNLIFYFVSIIPRITDEKCYCTHLPSIDGVITYMCIL